MRILINLFLFLVAISAGIIFFIDERIKPIEKKRESRGSFLVHSVLRDIYV